MNWQEVLNYPVYMCTTKTSNRLHNTLKQLQTVGVTNINIVYGIDARTNNGRQEVQEKALQRGWIISNFKRHGEIALTLAFMDTLEKFLTSTETRMVWFEDDVIAHPYFNTLVGDIIQFKEWDKFNLHYLGCGVPHKRDEIFNNIKNHKTCIETTKQRVWGTHALIIDRFAAQELIKNPHRFQVIDEHISNVFNKSSELKSAAFMYPLPLQQEIDYLQGYSQIEYSKEYKQLSNKWSEYRLEFIGRTMMCGLFLQRNVESVLQTQPKINTLEVVK